MTVGPPATTLVTLADVEAAREVLAGVVRMTPLEPSRPLTATLGGPAWLKCENVQRAGSYKVRGAYRAHLPADRRGAGPRRGGGERRQPRPGRRARRRACSAPRPPCSCRSARRCRRWRRPRATARRSSSSATRSTRPGRGAGVRRAYGCDPHPPVRPPGRDRRPGHGRAGDPRAVPRRAHDHHRHRRRRADLGDRGGRQGAQPDGTGDRRAGGRGGRGADAR